MNRARGALWIALCLAAMLTSASILCWPSPQPAAPDCRLPSMRVFKREGVLQLLCEGQVTREMGVTFGWNPKGPKEREGDGRTPEGAYHISSMTKSEHFDRFLAVSYPNEHDLRRARDEGIDHPGSGIGIHGTTKALAPLARAWIRFVGAIGIADLIGPTEGCIGISNEDVEVLYNAVSVDTPISIAAARPRGAAADP